MGAANFFDKALLSVAQVIDGRDSTYFLDRLNNHSVALVFDTEAVRSAEGLSALDLTCRLLARLYPRMVIAAQDRGAASHALKLRSLARAINPNLEISGDVGVATQLLVVGTTVAPEGAVYIGSLGWLARLSSTRPVGSGGTSLSFGAGAAACLGAANIFRKIFSDDLPGGKPDGEVSLSLLTYSTGDEAEPGPDKLNVDFGEAHLAGLGAIGNGVIWALSRLEGASGTLHGIDPEHVDLSNLQRYVLTLQKDISLPKTQVAKKAFSGKKIKFAPHQCSWGDYLRTRSDWNLPRVLTALDTAADRIAAQAALPCWIANSWTQSGDLGVSRHEFLGPGPCLACLYLPQSGAPNLDDVIATAIGMPEEESRMRLRELLHRNSPVGPDFIREVADRLQISSEALMKYQDMPLSAFYAEAVCGGAVFKLSDGKQQGAAEVPLAFQSALAGVMLAAELIAHASGLRPQPLRPKTIINLLQPLGTVLSYPVAKGRPGSPIRCICEDGDYLAAYSQKYVS